MKKHFLTFLSYYYALMYFSYFKVILKGIHLVSIMGNHGTVTKPLFKIITDAELLYHCSYLIFCLLGIMFHPFFYSVLVSIMQILILFITLVFFLNITWFTAIWCCLPRRNPIECYSICYKKRKVYYFNSCTCFDSGLYVLDYWLHVL